MDAMSPSGAGFNPIDPQVPEDASAGAAAGLLAGLTIGSESGGSLGPEGALFGGIIGGVVGFFSNLISGGGGPPPWVIWKLTHRGGNLQEWVHLDQVNQAEVAIALEHERAGPMRRLVGDNDG